MQVTKLIKYSVLLWIVDNTKSPTMINKLKVINFGIERRFGTSDEAVTVRVRAADRAGRRLVTGVRSTLRAQWRRRIISASNSLSSLDACPRWPVLFWVRHREMLVFLQAPKRYQNEVRSRYYNMWANLRLYMELLPNSTDLLFRPNTSTWT